MHAVTISQPGGPEVLGWGEAPDPVCGPGEVVVDVAATAVNRADLLQRQGFYPPPPGASEILGLECSGVISEVGELLKTVSYDECVRLAGIAVDAADAQTAKARVRAELPQLADLGL